MSKVLIYSQEDLDLILELEKEKNEKIQQENKILKQNAENNDKVVDKVNWENQLLKKENKQLKELINKATNELFILKNMIYKPETREENFEIQRKISSLIKRLNGKEVSE